MITQKHIGTHKDQDVIEFTLSNNNGVIVKLINYGATISSIIIPDGEGGNKNIVCGFDKLSGYFGEDYLANAPYFGCTIGRYASRIKDGKFTLNDTSYELAVNNGSNHLHGGIFGFDKKVWDAKLISSDEQSGVQMMLVSPDMDEGYPGTVEIKVNFSLCDNNEITISYEAQTDKATPLSLTNHSYFNLSGFKETIENHIGLIDSMITLVPDSSNVPVGDIEDVSGKIDDLREGKRLGDCFNEMETGFEHFYVFNKPVDELASVASFTDAGSGTKLEISTTEPGVIFYTGYFTSDKLRRESGEQYGRFRGLCFETSRFPNGPNLPDSPNSITQPNETYTSTTIFKISQRESV